MICKDNEKQDLKTEDFPKWMSQLKDDLKRNKILAQNKSITELAQNYLKIIVK